MKARLKLRDRARMPPTGWRPLHRSGDGRTREVQHHIGALQEMKWFGSAAYKVGKSVVIAAGRPTPHPGQGGQRGKDSAKWTDYQCMEKRRTTMRVMGLRDSLHLLSATQYYGYMCYHAMLLLSPLHLEIWRTDWFTVCHKWNSTKRTPYPSGTSRVNTHMGSRVHGGVNQWEQVRGWFDIGEVYDAGRELLNFPMSNEATICNTWFKIIHQQTWQHPV